MKKVVGGPAVCCPYSRFRPEQCPRPERVSDLQGCCGSDLCGRPIKCCRGSILLQPVLASPGRQRGCYGGGMAAPAAGVGQDCSGNVPGPLGPFCCHGQPYMTSPLLLQCLVDENNFPAIPARFIPIGRPSDRGLRRLPLGARLSSPLATIRVTGTGALRNTCVVSILNIDTEYSCRRLRGTSFFMNMQDSIFQILGLGIASLATIARSSLRDRTQQGRLSNT